MHEDQDMRDELPSGAEMLGMEVASATRRDVVEHLQPYCGDETPAAATGDGSQLVGHRTGRRHP